jgi:hypothetical protein
MSCPYTFPQNGKVERIIHLVNNVIHTLLIQASLPRYYWAEGLHTATYLLNCLPTTVIQATCPHLALFGSTPSYEHLRVFDCTCYPNTTVTVPHKLSPRFTRCVFLGYSANHKGYRGLDLSTNRLIISSHVVFDEDSFPLAASPSLTNLDFLCESGPIVSTIGTHLTTAATSTRHLTGQHRRSLRALSPLWLPYPPRQFLQDFCPGRLPRLRHAWPRLHHLPSQTARYPVHGRPHRFPTSGALGSPRRRVPLHHPLFCALPWAVRVWWCLSRP